MTAISSDIVPTHQLRRTPAIEAWLYSGQPFAQWPDWLRSGMEASYGPGNVPKPPRHAWALRDDEGYFWRWMKLDEFERRYEPAVAPRSDRENEQ